VHRRKWIATIIMKDFWIIGFSISEKTGWRGVDFKWEQFTFGDLDLKYIKSDLCLFGSLFLWILVFQKVSKIKKHKNITHVLEFHLVLLSHVPELWFMKSHLSMLSLSCCAAFHWESSYLYLLTPEYFLLFPVSTLEFGVWY
jgi:hypothetical protein